MFDTRRKRGRDIESTHDGATVLRFVCHLGYMEIVRYLRRVSASAITSDGAQAVFRASIEGHLEIVQYLIKDCHIDAAVKVANAGTALHGASHFSTLSCCTVFDSRMPSQCINKSGLWRNSIPLCESKRSFWTLYNISLPTVVSIRIQRICMVKSRCIVQLWEDI